MSSVLYKEGFSFGPDGERLPVLVFDYGILEIPPGGVTGFSMEAIIQGALIEHGMRHGRANAQKVTAPVSLEGDILRIQWFEGNPADEMQVSERWIAEIRAVGGFGLIYLNMHPEEDLSFSELEDRGALWGIVEMAEVRDDG